MVLFVKARDQRLKLHVGGLRVLCLGVNLKNGLHQPVGNDARDKPRDHNQASNDDDHDEQVLAHDAPDAAPVKAQTQDIARGQEPCVIEAHVPQRVRVAVRLPFATPEGIGYLWAIGVVLERGGIHPGVIEHGAIRRH